MTKEKQIEEMAECLIDIQRDFNEYCAKPCRECELAGIVNCENHYKAEALYNAGYRKQSEVIDEFTELLKKEMNNLSRMEYHCDPYFLVSKDFVDRIAAKMKGGEEK